MTGDLLEYEPGSRIDVEAVADAGGAVPTRGMGVEVVGENRSFTEVQLTQGQASYGLGHISTDPDDYDEDATYAAGDSAGRASVFLYHPIVLLNPADAYAPSVGDAVTWDAGGTVNAYGDGTGATPSPMGVVFATGSRDFGSAGKVAVAKFD